MSDHARASRQSVHLILPAGYADPRRPSGGNVYDRELCTGLASLGWTVVDHEIADAWPTPRPQTAVAVDRALAAIGCDEVVVVDGLLATAAAEVLVEHAARLRLVLLVHMPGPPGGPPAEVLRAARLVVTTSQWTARALADQHGLPGDRLVVARPGAPRTALTTATATGTAAGGALLCVGAVVRTKGHDVLVRALAGISDVPWTCVCVGSLDREPAFVQTLCRDLAETGIEDRVRFEGSLAQPDVARAYAAADVLVLPTRLESYGMVVTEALAHGVPVIATAVGGVPEALGFAANGRRPGILVEPDDDRALAEAISRWLGDPLVRAGLRSAARSRRRSLCHWEDTVGTISDAIARLALE